MSENETEAGQMVTINISLFTAKFEEMVRYVIQRRKAESPLRAMLLEAGEIASAARGVHLLHSMAGIEPPMSVIKRLMDEQTMLSADALGFPRSHADLVNEAATEDLIDALFRDYEKNVGVEA